VFYVIDIRSRNAIITVHILLKKTTTTMEKKKCCKAGFIKCNTYRVAQKNVYTLHSLLINIFGINLNEISTSG